MDWKIIHVFINTFGCYLKMYITIVAIGIKITNKGTMLLLHMMNKEKSLFGIIQSFMLYNSSPPLLFCVLAKLVRSDHPFTMFCSSYQIPHIIPCLPPTRNPEIVVIPFERICSLCVYMSFSDITDTVYVVIPSNLFEKD